MWDLSCVCDLCCSSQQCQIITHWARTVIKPASSWIPVRFELQWELLVVFFFFFLSGCICSIWKFPGQGMNLCCSCDLCHSCSNATSLICYATRELSRLSFLFLEDNLWYTNFFYFKEVQFVYFFFCFYVIYKYSCSNKRSWRLIPMFSSKNFIILALIFRYLMHFELIFLHGVRKGSNCTLWHVNIQSTILK